jgi:hypothetical protein
VVFFPGILSSIVGSQSLVMDLTDADRRIANGRNETLQEILETLKNHAEWESSAIKVRKVRA